MAFRTLITASRVAVYVPNTSGDPDAPWRDPINNVKANLLNSAFGYYAVGHAEDTVVNHLAVGAIAGETYSAALMSYLVLTQRTVVSHVIATHNFGYVPRFVVADENYNMLPVGLPIQQISPGGRRSVVIRATTTQIILDEFQMPANSGLPAITKTYRVRCYRRPGPVAGAPGFLASASRVRLASGAIDSAERSLRLAKAGETPYFSSALSRISDLDNGQVRFIAADGVVRDTSGVLGGGTSGYGGNFAGPAVVKVVI